LPTLDGWRAIAIALVFIDHSRGSVLPLLGIASDKAQFIGSLGYTGVRVFFGISGFLIGSRLIEEAALRGRISLRGFYLRRCFRILPPLVALLLTLLMLTAFGVISVPMRSFVPPLFFVSNYFPRDVYLAHLWSLSVEEQFYLVFPALLVLAGRGGFPICCALAVGIALWRAVTLANPLYATHIIADGLLWGGVVAFLYASPTRDRLRTALRPAVWWFLCGGFVLSFLVKSVIPDGGPKNALYSLQSLLIPLVIAGTVLNSQGVAGRLLELAPVRWIGRLSYSLYLWQQLFLFGSSSESWFGFLKLFPVNLLMSFACAALSYYVLELPMMRLGHWLARPATSGRKELVVSIPAEADARGGGTCRMENGR
jgi:peptidoglycan/LPS O-acetylase OafA/YrhL